MTKLPKSFYQRQDVVKIALELIGKVLVTNVNETLTSGVIMETEAYSDRERGCHAYKGMTARNKVMFGEGGIAYVYLCYGIHRMMNVVTNKKGKADAVLIRALKPLVGIDRMIERARANSIARLTSGPGKLTKALGIGRELNGQSLKGSDIWIQDEGINVTKHQIVSSPRIGIDYAGEDALLPWRFSFKDSEWVSR
ncbi:MAG: DNA-3-methyladenine glycosylase [Cytophagales bacterium]|jgi:DNA-3-methyladenine glycosylase|nr:DNA-3-methyladenine glycosylase [Cytophagales bacterium]MCA6387302.1 DNA-3-methyladenine glycosylase [Cytophagales bacterium]MCA6393961.1 DNA-3-methyladenine glycosylase [Cytophagales bacterium]MCA6398895.1 DNA-3-methyladenine glycosylase [Cytophagales bacterium]MCA6402804.1 DNA-3-methyladenine glycosylase [Cytophagales bacterium]